MPVHETSAEEERAIAGAVNRMWRRKQVAAPTQALATTYKPSLPTDPNPLVYAPPAHRIENVTAIPVKEVEVVTGEIEEIIKAAKDEIAELERNALVVRALYVEQTKRISEHIKRLRAGVKLSMETLDALKQQCVALDAPTDFKDSLEADIAEIASKFKPDE